MIPFNQILLIFDELDHAVWFVSRKLNFVLFGCVAHRELSSFNTIFVNLL